MKVEIRSLLSQNLVQVSGNPSVVIPWKNIFVDLVRKHRIQLVGWPKDLVGPVRNPSEISNHVESLQALRDAARQGTCHFERVSVKDLRVLESKYATEVAAGTTKEKAKRKRCSDLGSRRGPSDKAAAKVPAKKGKQSKETVDSEDESDDEEEEEEAPSKRRRKAPAKKGKKSKETVDSEGESDEEEEEEEDAPSKKRRMRKTSRQYDDDGRGSSPSEQVDGGVGTGDENEGDGVPEQDAEENLGVQPRFAIRLGPSGSVSTVVLGAAVLEGSVAQREREGVQEFDEGGREPEGGELIGRRTVPVVNGGNFDERNIMSGARDRRPRTAGALGWN